MKTIKQVEISVVEVEFIPEKMEFGELYYSNKYQCTEHLCLCGCGHPCYLPLGINEWTLTRNENKPTITPSILQRFDCKSHYIITNGIANFV